ncbi:MAG: HEAT repeat domain-containing protein [Phycisphaerae bacterium]|nr:HEAT repeat domain-containing protein [Phycisphaerae bacterium]
MKDWTMRLVVLLLMVPAVCVNGAAPKVVGTVPQNGDQTVWPGLQRIRIVFDQDMEAGGYSLCTTDAQFPEISGEPRWADKRTLILAAKLKPGTEYGMSINSLDHKNFKNVLGEPAEVHVVTFKTAAAGGAVAAASIARSPAMLLQQGRYAEETEGDLDKAIELYEQAIERADRIQRIAAEATFQLGMCHLKKGDKAAAGHYFGKVVKDFADQTSVVEKARQQLGKIEPEKVDSVFEQMSDQVLTFVAQTYGILVARAMAESLPCNAHLYCVDADFNGYSGGLGYHYNWTGRSLTGRVHLSGTSVPDQTLYDATGEKLDIEIVADQERANFYHIYWIPKEPLKPQEALYFGWSNNKKRALNRLPDSGGAMLTMHNEYGPKVLETFFLVLPAGLEIAGEAKPTETRDFGDYKVLWWTKEVPEKTSHTENVLIRTRAGVTDATVVANTVGEVVLTISTCAETDPRVAASLVKLKPLDAKKAVTEVARYLDSDKATVRRSAIFVLWRGGFDSIGPVEKKLVTLCSHSENLTRGMAALALGAAKAEASYDALVKMTLDDADGYARRCAAYALGCYGDAKALDVLQKAVQDKDPLVGQNAQAAINMLTEKKDK